MPALLSSYVICRWVSNGIDAKTMMLRHHWAYHEQHIGYGCVAGAGSVVSTG